MNSKGPIFIQPLYLYCLYICSRTERSFKVLPIGTLNCFRWSIQSCAWETCWQLIWTIHRMSPTTEPSNSGHIRVTTIRGVLHPTNGLDHEADGSPFTDSHGSVPKWIPCVLECIGAYYITRFGHSTKFTAPQSLDLYGGSIRGSGTLEESASDHNKCSLWKVSHSHPQNFT